MARRCRQKQVPCTLSLRSLSTPVPHPLDTHKGSGLELERADDSPVVAVAAEKYQNPDYELVQYE